MLVYLETNGIIVGEMEFNNMKEGDKKYETLKKFGNLYIIENVPDPLYILRVNEVISKFNWRSKVYIVVNVYNDYDNDGDLDLKLLKCSNFVSMCDDIIHFVIKKLPSKVEALIDEHLLKKD